ncbi:hypothetical protein ACOSQ2_004176 [Xanthoceras sorbifolium]
MTAFKAVLMSSFANSRASIPRNGVSSLSKLFSTSHPKSIISKESLMAQEDRAQLREFLYGKCKSGKIDLHEALYFFDYMIHLQPIPPMACFSILFAALVKNKHYGYVISLQKKLNSVGLVPNLITSNILINCFSKMGRVGNGFVPRCTFNCLINGLCAEGRIMEATRLPNKILAPNVVWYGSMIDGLCKDGFIDKAKELFLEMLNQGVQPDVVTFSVLLDELCKAGKIDEANRLYEFMIKGDVQPNTYTYNILMDGYCLVGRIRDAEKLFVSMASKGCMPDVVSYGILIDGEMISKDMRPTVVTYNSMLIGLFRASRVGDGRKLFEEIQSNDLFHSLPHKGLVPDVVAYNIMINGLCKERELEKANSLLWAMEEKGERGRLIYSLTKPTHHGFLIHVGFSQRY